MFSVLESELEEKLLECNGTNENEIEDLVSKLLGELSSQSLESIVAGNMVIKSIEKVVLTKSDHRASYFLLNEVKNHFLASHEMCISYSLF